RRIARAPSAIDYAACIKPDAAFGNSPKTRVTPSSACDLCYKLRRRQCARAAAGTRRTSLTCFKPLSEAGRSKLPPSDQICEKVTRKKSNNCKYDLPSFPDQKASRAPQHRRASHQYL